VGLSQPQRRTGSTSIALDGAMGGASLGLALQGWEKAGVAALVGAVGFSVANLIGLFIQLAIWGFEPAPYFARFFIGPIVGIVFGASLGQALRGWKAAILLALAEAIGFGAWFQAVSNLVFEVSSAKSFGIWGCDCRCHTGNSFGLPGEKENHTKYLKCIVT
jgi:hypothetical protein